MAACYHVSADQKKSMNAHNVTSENEKSAMETGDWGTEIPSESRQGFVNEILDMMKRHPQFSGTDDQLRKCAEVVEEKLYNSSRDKRAYQTRTYTKLHQIREWQEAFSTEMPPLLLFLEPQTPTKLPICVNGAEIRDNWREEVYQKIETMRETYLPDIIEIHEEFAAKRKQWDSFSQQLEMEHPDELKAIEIKLMRIILVLSASKSQLVPVYEKELNSYYEKQIIDFINAYKSMKPISFQLQELLSLPDLPSWLPTFIIPKPEVNDPMNRQLPLMVPFILPTRPAQMQSQHHQIQQQQGQHLHDLEQQLPGNIETDELPHSYQWILTLGFLKKISRMANIRVFIHLLFHFRHFTYTLSCSICPFYFYLVDSISRTSDL
ncbi:mediator of RNA polymerase II transcription subunit 15a-like [Hibiscus syriacus]|uniref:mediator of RNA polymerase II transcription subunit 15a-like n=1 Tax=Hibiscus syriacus TaxID=106335 RepID=UPI0019247A6F|nr:mediator of RNA polymerase II transcription subunit 15a-like [Hibiscus syriacus]XP_039004285.1 mediator of RNA polymerase II transcription subunit 15a-like [Hibiscus syriacus]